MKSTINYALSFILLIFCTDAQILQISHYYSKISSVTSPRGTGAIACSATCSRTDGCCGYAFKSPVCELILAHDVEVTCGEGNKTCYVRTTNPCEPPTTIEATTVEATTVEATTVEASTVEASTVETSTVEATTVEPTTLQITLVTPCIESMRKDTSDSKIYVTYFSSDTLGIFATPSPADLHTGTTSGTNTKSAYYPDTRTGLIDVFTYMGTRSYLVFVYGTHVETCNWSYSAYRAISGSHKTLLDEYGTSAPSSVQAADYDMVNSLYLVSGDNIYEFHMSGGTYTFSYVFQRVFTLSDTANNPFPYGSGPIPSGLDSLVINADVMVGTAARILYEYDRTTQVWSTHGTDACL